MFYEGRQIGSYTLLRKLGKGGFGEVWLAEKRSQFITKKVAVKLPLDEQVNFDAVRQEAELWEQASGHANVLPIIDADIVDGQVIIVSEYADGGSLSDHLKREGRLSLQKAVEMTIGILNGLEFLHNRKIIHRDIKPQNILLQGETPRLADFGISRAMNTTIVSSTIIGTDAYMSPESFDGKRNVQTDIWSVGVVLYALLADKLPFSQEHPSERMFAILTKEFEPLPVEIPLNLQRIVYRALAKSPENRYRTTTEMRDELQKVHVGIAHPTFAPTEVFRIPTENLPTIPTAGNQIQTNEPEKETVFNQPPANFPPPPQAAFQQESIATNFRAIPPPTSEPTPTQTPNNPYAAKFQLAGNQMPNKAQISTNSSTNVRKKTNQLKYIIPGGIGLLTLLIVCFAILTKNNSNSSDNSNYSSLAARNSSTSSSNKPLNNRTGTYNTDSNSNPNSDPNNNPNNNSSSSVPSEMKIELKTTRDVITNVFIDGKFEPIYEMSAIDKKYTARQTFKFEYEESSREAIQLKINGNAVTLPKKLGNASQIISFEISKYNYDQVLQSGSNVGQKTLNTNISTRSSNR